MLVESGGSPGDDPLHPVRLSLDGLLPIRACLHLTGQCQVSLPFHQCKMQVNSSGENWKSKRITRRKMKRSVTRTGTTGPNWPPLQRYNRFVQVDSLPVAPHAKSMVQ